MKYLAAYAIIDLADEYSSINDDSSINRRVMYPSGASCVQGNAFTFQIRWHAFDWVDWANNWNSCSIVHKVFDVKTSPARWIIYERVYFPFLSRLMTSCERWTISLSLFLSLSLALASWSFEFHEKKGGYCGEIQSQRGNSKRLKSQVYVIDLRVQRNVSWHSGILNETETESNSLSKSNDRLIQFWSKNSRNEK